MFEISNVHFVAVPEFEILLFGTVGSHVDSKDIERAIQCTKVRSRNMCYENTFELKVNHN